MKGTIALIAGVGGAATALLTALTAYVNYRKTAEEKSHHDSVRVELVKSSLPSNAYPRLTRLDKAATAGFIIVLLAGGIATLVIVALDHSAWLTGLYLIVVAGAWLMIVHEQSARGRPLQRSSACYKEEIVVRGELRDLMRSIRETLKRMNIDILTFDEKAGRVHGRGRKRRMPGFFAEFPDRVWIAVEDYADQQHKITVEWDGGLATHNSRAHRKSNQKNGKRFLALLLEVRI